MAKCGEVMTREPACCQASDSIVRVAQVMKTQDVGAIPIVESKSGQKLVGMITDRDIVVRILGNGTPLENATVRDAMTTNPVTCREDEDVSHAVSRMAERQIRRIPVVDGEGQLRGIIAQADIATRVHQDKTTGELVEAISEPGTVRK